MRHFWVKYGKWVTCKRCGILQKDNNKDHGKCKHVSVSTRKQDNPTERME